MEPMAPRSAAWADTSDSLVGSLCREMARILGRQAVIASALASCGSVGLIQRLRNERDALARRQRELVAVAERLRLAQGLDPLSVAFFQELTRRKAAI
jgi:hypothetical protein